MLKGQSDGKNQRTPQNFRNSLRAVNWCYFKIILISLKSGWEGSGSPKVINCKFSKVYYLVPMFMYRKSILVIMHGDENQIKVTKGNQVQRSIDA